MQLREVADSAGISMSYLSDIERATKSPALDVLVAIANALETDVVTLLAGRHTFDRTAPRRRLPQVQDGRRRS